MAVKHKNASPENPQLPLIKGAKLAIAVADYYKGITDPMLEAAIGLLCKQGVKRSDIYIHTAPGAFELPALARWMCEAYPVQAVICFGCVIKGDTDHDKYINHSVAQALQQLAILFNKPFLFGVLTPNSMKQAKDRSGGKHGNKGIEVAQAAIRMIDLQRTLKKKK